MREKILSLAKGNFIYMTPELVLPEEPLTLSVVSGERLIYSFSLKNVRGSRLKGFGAAEDVHIDFLPFFEGTDNELTMEINAEELAPGEHLRGELLLVTDCGEAQVPYDISVVAPELRDEKGAVRDYHALQDRIEENPEHGVDLFLSDKFQEAFLYRNESGKILYYYLTKKNTKLQGMEEFLVAMKVKESLRFEIHHESGNQISYELNGTDIQDTLRIRVNTWGHTGIYVTGTADFIEPHIHVLWTDEFEHKQDILEFTIVADKVPQGRRFGQLILQTPYEKKIVQIEAHNQWGEQERKINRAKKAAIATMIQMYLAFQEKRITRTNFQSFLKSNRYILEKVSGRYSLAMRGYIAIILCEEEDILSFFQETENLEVPPLGAETSKVESYITIQFVKTLYTKREEDKERLLHLIEAYEENGYQTSSLTYIRTQIDKRYRSLRLLEKDVRAQLEAGSSSPFLYSVMMQAYREDATLIASLDTVTVNTVDYGLKRDLTTKEVAMAVSFLAERLPSYDETVFRILQHLYDFFVMTDTLHAICSMLIRNEIRHVKYFPWFAKGVAKRLRLTDLFEYYMYTMDYEKVTRLPDVVLSYFQYENHLNATCKAFLYSYIVKNSSERPEFYRMYHTQIKEFAFHQLEHRRISPHLAVLYEELLHGEEIRDEVAVNVSHIMFSYGIWCDNEQMDGVVVVHKECEGETYYPLENGYTQVAIYTPNVQIYFVDDAGRYYTETIEYRMERLLDFDNFAWQCYEEGAECLPLLIHLAAKAERMAKIDEQHAEVLHRVLKRKKLREYMQQRVLLCLYDYYRETKNIPLLLEILDNIDSDKIKRERLGDVAADCIYQGMFDKATAMLCRGGVEQCELAALSMLVTELIQKNSGEFEPLLLKWAFHLYRKKHYEKAAMEYLLRYYMGDVATMASIYRICRKMPEVEMGEEADERLLAQLLFVDADLAEYVPLYQEYYEKGDNRMLAKAFLSRYAYEYVVERTELSEELFVLIEKEARYEKDLVMVLAALRYYREQKTFTGKLKEFVELSLEKCAGEGLILAFMKDYINKVNVPHEIENTVLVQYYSGTDRDVFLCEQKPDGEMERQPMKQVFPGVFTRELLLFGDEEKKCCIYEEETDEKTGLLTVRRAKDITVSQGFFRMVNEMIEAKEQEDEDKYREVRSAYERARYAAERLFVIH